MAAARMLELVPMLMCQDTQAFNGATKARCFRAS